ncbi:MAG: AAA family ATPase [Ignavibacteria bacterium]|nr:AAA family ATPase [Ignavibacteria bacterium]
MTDKYKFKSLKIHGEDEWLYGSQKKYRRVLEESEITYIYVELALFNKLFDEENWSTKVNFKAYDSKGKIMCDDNIDRDVNKDENIAYIRTSWGVKTPGGYWKKGSYRWEAWIDGALLGTEYFYIENQGVVTEESNNYFNLMSVKLFEGPVDEVPISERRYLKTFDTKNTRYIWLEMNAENLVREEWTCELFFTFKNEAGETKGLDNQYKFLKKDDEFFTFTGGWGNASGTSWYPGKYYLEISFMDCMIARIPFYVRDVIEEDEQQNLLLTSPSEKNTFSKKPVKNKEQSEEEILSELNGLIGLTEIKTSIKQYSDYIKFLKIRQEKGLDKNVKISLHSVFTGNPGTGKTTVANLLGKIYKSLGLLSKGHVYEVDRADLVGEYIGHTAPKVKAAIEKARGGILFIDEAYSLARSGEDSKDYGKEVIEIIIKEMSDGPGDIAMIVAGYPKEMKVFIDSNPGLKSRFNMYYSFPDYVPQELMQIADHAAIKKGVSIEPQARNYLYDALVEGYRTRDNSFGNARYVNSIIEEAKMNMGLRLIKNGGMEKYDEQELSTIKTEDIQKIFAEHKGIRADIPIDEELLKIALFKLHSMIGIENVKNEINEIVKLVRYFKEIGKDVNQSMSLHSVFMGNPGTGKTTVARILADIYKALGLLEKGHLVECDRESLVGGYVGQTAIKTGAMIDSAMGGVLFIDEAYALSSGGSDFGAEAIEIILKRMEDLRGKFVVIVAGYTKNMQVFLESNPGLKSRFDKTFNFEDYNENELYWIALKLLTDNRLTPDEDAKNYLYQYCIEMHKNKDDYFGNGREVRKVVEEAVRNQNLRLADTPKEKRTKEMIETLTKDDLAEFKIDELKKGKKVFGFGKE